MASFNLRARLSASKGGREAVGGVVGQGAPEQPLQVAHRTAQGTGRHCDGARRNLDR